MRDQLLSICRELVRIDNRPTRELAEDTGLSKATIYRLRNGVDLSYMRTPTVLRIAKAMRKTVVIR